MRYLDLQEALWSTEFTPTLFDEIIVRHGDAFFAITGATVLVPGGEGGPGCIALEIGEEVAVAPELRTTGQRLYDASQATWVAEATPHAPE